jgi:hypothetical protein
MQHGATIKIAALCSKKLHLERQEMLLDDLFYRKTDQSHEIMGDG